MAEQESEVRHLFLEHQVQQSYRDAAFTFTRWHGQHDVLFESIGLDTLGDIDSAAELVVVWLHFGLHSPHVAV